MTHGKLKEEQRVKHCNTSAGNTLLAVVTAGFCIRQTTVTPQLVLIHNIPPDVKIMTSKNL